MQAAWNWPGAIAATQIQASVQQPGAPQYANPLPAASANPNPYAPPLPTATSLPNPYNAANPAVNTTPTPNYAAYYGAAAAAGAVASTIAPTPATAATPQVQQQLPTYTPEQWATLTPEQQAWHMTQWHQQQQYYLQWQQQYQAQQQQQVAAAAYANAAQPPLPAVPTPQVGPPLPEDNKRSLEDKGESSANKKQKTDEKGGKTETLDDLLELRRSFDTQFSNWENEYFKWKEANANHPDQAQKKEYEAKWSQWREQLLHKRDVIDKKINDKRQAIEEEKKKAEEEKQKSQNAWSNAYSALNQSTDVKTNWLGNPMDQPLQFKISGNEIPGLDSSNRSDTNRDQNSGKGPDKPLDNTKPLWTSDNAPFNFPPPNPAPMPATAPIPAVNPYATAAMANPFGIALPGQQYPGMMPGVMPGVMPQAFNPMMPYQYQGMQGAVPFQQPGVIPPVVPTMGATPIANQNPQGNQQQPPHQQQPLQQQQLQQQQQQQNNAYPNNNSNQPNNNNDRPNDFNKTNDFNNRQGDFNNSQDDNNRRGDFNRQGDFNKPNDFSNRPGDLNNRSQNDFNKNQSSFNSTRSSYVDKYAQKYEKDDTEDYHNRFAAEDGDDDWNSNNDWDNQRNKNSRFSQEQDFGFGRNSSGKKSWGNDNKFENNKFGGGKDLGSIPSLMSLKSDIGNPPGFGSNSRDMSPMGPRGMSSHVGPSQNTKKWSNDENLPPTFVNQQMQTKLEEEKPPRTCVVIEYNHKNVPCAMSIELVKGYNEPYKGPVHVFEYSHGANKQSNKYSNNDKQFFREGAVSSNLNRRRSPLLNTNNYSPMNVSISDDEFERNTYPRHQSEKYVREKRDLQTNEDKYSHEKGRNENKYSYRNMSPQRDKPNLKRHHSNQQDRKEHETKEGSQIKIAIEDILDLPGRVSRPNKICIFLRGPPCSGKSFLSKIIKDKETQYKGDCRILSLDDYYMTNEVEKQVTNERGFKKTIKTMEYEYDAALESSYKLNLVKSFKKNINDNFFKFILVDSNNTKIKDFQEMHDYSKQKGYVNYIIETNRDLNFCLNHNIHDREEKDIKREIDKFETTPNSYLLLDVTSLLQSAEIEDVDMEDVSEDEYNDDETMQDVEDDDDNDTEEQSKFIKSKWDNVDSLTFKDKLDGLIHNNKKQITSIKDWLNTNEDDDELAIYNKSKENSNSNKKRVRWADIEEKYEQDKMKAIGFIVGQTDWNRMLDPHSGIKRMNQTKYI